MDGRTDQQTGSVLFILSVVPSCRLLPFPSIMHPSFFLLLHLFDSFFHLCSFLPVTLSILTFFVGLSFHPPPSFILPSSLRRGSSFLSECINTNSSIYSQQYDGAVHIIPDMSWVRSPWECGWSARLHLSEWVNYKNNSEWQLITKIVSRKLPTEHNRRYFFNFTGN